MDALDPAVVDNALARLPQWRHSGEFLVRHIPVHGGDTAKLQEQVHAVEGSAERCTFTDTGEGVMIYLGDVAGEGIAEADFATAERIDAAIGT